MEGQFLFCNASGDVIKWNFPHALKVASLYGPIVYRNVGQTMPWFDLKGPHNSSA